MAKIILNKAATRYVGKLCGLALLMFSFGFLMAPLYDVVCRVTGIGGKTGRVSVADAQLTEIDTTRTINISFDTNLNTALPWVFSVPKPRTVSVHPGEVKEVIFTVENLSKQEITGQAVPSVAPASASLFFNKTECFCFTKQILKPGERREMPVRFIVNQGLPEKTSHITLSYSFFPI